MLAAPFIVPASVWGANAPSNIIRLGQIGCGSRGNELMAQVLRAPQARYGALADCDRPFLLRYQQIVEDQYGIDRKPPQQDSWKVIPVPEPEGAVDAYEDYRRILDRNDIDAVIVAVPDHWHAKIYIDAMDAGKDVYGEKPLALTIEQGRHIARKAEETGRIFQTGSQQRSDAKFRKACELIRNGRLGNIKHVDIAVGGSRAVAPMPDTPPPPGLNWDLWLGPAPWVPYNPLRCHLTFRYFWDYSGGTVTDWGAHHCDICQWALGMDHSGPRFVEGQAETVQPNYFETFTQFDFTFTYTSGTTARLHSRGNDIVFHGEKGTLTVNRGKLQCDKPKILETPLRDSDERLYQSDNHMQNWLDCIKSRTQPICPAEVGHRSLTLSHIANICGKLGRKLEWDPEHEVFVNDHEANLMLSREERPPYHHRAGG